MTGLATTGTEQLHIGHDAWKQLHPTEQAALMARNVFPAVDLGAGALRVQPRNVIDVKGMGGKFYDFRGTGLLPPSGGLIRVQVGVEHIPVIHQAAGLDDFFTLASVLRQRGLSLQAATDGTGNAVQYNRLDALCWQAKGANSISYGVEHMHFAIDEAWSRRQFRAAAYMMWRAQEYQGIPLIGGKLVQLAPGVVGATRKGHVSHKYVSATAGFFDRVDPGPLFRWQHCYELAAFFDEHRRF